MKSIEIFIGLLVALCMGIIIGSVPRSNDVPHDLDVYVTVCEDGYNKVTHIPYVAPKRDVRIEEELCKIYEEENQ